MKKVLALVLALTMIVGFASTAMANYTYNGINLKYDLFSAKPAAETFKVGDINYYKDMAVEGNKEYKMKVEFDEAALANYFGTTDDTYKALAKEVKVLEIIEEYYGYSANRAWTKDQVVNNTDGQRVPMTQALYDYLDRAGDLTAQSTLVNKLFGADKTNFGEMYTSADFQAAKAALLRDMQNYNNGYYGLGKGLVATATSKDETYAVISSPASVTSKYDSARDETVYTVEWKVRFTNTTFKMADVGLKLVMQAGSSIQGAYYEASWDFDFDVYQAQSRTFTAQDAQIAFGVTPNVEISAKDYAYISADAFRIMLQNNARTLTVVNGVGNSKIRFDSDSTNLPQDVFVGNFTTTGTASTAASISGFSSTTAAKIKIAVGEAFKTAAAGKTLSVYDANNNKLNVEATLQGDNTVNFFAPLSNYTVATSDWSGQTVPVTPGKDNPSMGGK